MALNPEEVGWLLKMIQNTHEVELGCSECADVLDEYVQKVLGEKPLEGNMHLVKQHLESCSSCDDEFRLILETLQSLGDDDESTEV